MTVEFTNNKFDYFSAYVGADAIGFSTLYWFVKNQFYNDGDTANKYANLMINETKRR